MEKPKPIKIKFGETDDLKDGWHQARADYHAGIHSRFAEPRCAYTMGYTLGYYQEWEKDQDE